VTHAGVSELRRRTIPGQLALRARETPQTVAYRAKIRGVYRERTWADLRDLVARCAFGLRQLGLARGDRVAIMGDCCEGWTIADLAAQSLGASVVARACLVSRPSPAYFMSCSGVSNCSSTVVPPARTAVAAPGALVKPFAETSDARGCRRSVPGEMSPP